jgi:hypothetical protein
MQEGRHLFLPSNLVKAMRNHEGSGMLLLAKVSRSAAETLDYLPAVSAVLS